MALQFQTEDYGPKDPTLQLISSPLNAYLGGQQTARVQQSQQQALRDAEEVIKQRQLENVVKQREAAQADLEMQTPGFLEQMMRGRMGTAQQQQATGLEAMMTQPSSTAAKISGNTKQLSEDQWSAVTDMAASAVNQLQQAKDPINRAALLDEMLSTKNGQAVSALLGITKEDLLQPGSESRLVDAIRAGSSVRGLTPSSLAKEREGVVKAEAKGQGGFTPANSIAIANLASSLGISFEEAANIVTQGLGKIRGTQPQPTPQEGRIGFPTTQQPAVTPTNPLQVPPVVQQQRDSDRLAILEQELKANPNDPALQKEVQLERAKQQVPIAQPTMVGQEPSSLLGKQLERKTNSQREARYSDVVAIAGNEAQASIKNLVNMPVKATSGFFGEDVKLGNGLLDAPLRAVKKSLSKEYVNSYNAEVDNIGAYFARLMSGGLSATQADMDKFTNQYRVKEGETVLTALTRFAQMRQAFERAAEVKITSKATPTEQKAMWQDAVTSVRESIPLTVNDINEIRNSKNDSKTFAQVMKEKSASRITPEEFNTKWAELPSGESLIGPDGKVYRKK